MKIKAVKEILILVIAAVLCLIFAATPVIGKENENPLELMMTRIEKQEELYGEKAVYFRRLTPLLFDYLNTTTKQEEIEPLYQAQSVKELSSLIKKQFGKNVIEFGEKMFAYFEESASKNKDVILEQWSRWTSEHFVFFTHPGSSAEAEIDLIKKSAEDTFSSLAASLDIREEAVRSVKLLHTTSPKGRKVNNTKLFPGKIAVYLHQMRKGDVLKTIGKHSMGSMKFGATILESGDEKGWGKLTAQIDVLYFNTFSLVVLHHEIAHAVLFLGSFSTDPLTKQPLKGKSDLKKAFFAGYTPISPFLHEGIGDYIIYYHGFYELWPMLPEPEKIVQGFLSSDRYIPLNKLIRGDRRFRRRYHKEYSLEAASFLDYLIQTYGKAKLKKWFLSGKDSARTFKKIYQITIKEMEKKWQANIRGKLEVSAKKKDLVLFGDFNRTVYCTE